MTPNKSKKYQKEIKKGLAMSVHQNQKEDKLEYSGRVKDVLILPNEITLSGKNLTHGEMRTWIAIFSYCYNEPYRISWPGRKELAELIGASERGITRYLNGLKEKGLLLSKRRNNQTALYILCEPPKNWKSKKRQKSSLS